MVVLRRRLTCFYCGRRSVQKHQEGLRQWRCEDCEAVNHLDAQGNITDPPPLELPTPAPSRVRFAQAVQAPTSSAFGPADGILFCPTCIKHQHLVNENLANYLPAPTDPRYDEFEAFLPEYRKQLEERYPQVCADCEPRVTDRIRATGYAAKTDHLRRMMERSRGGQMVRQDVNGRRLLGFVGGAAWFAGLTGFMVWNIIGLTASPREQLREDTGLGVDLCLLAAVSGRKVGHHCIAEAYPWAKWSLVVSLASLWWNPNLLRATVGRASGLGEYYKLQGILYAARLAVWYFLGAEEADIDPGVVKAVHASILLLTTIVTLISIRTARMDVRARVNFKGNYESSAPQPHLTPATSQPQAQGMYRAPHAPASFPITSSFSIGNLAAPPARPQTPKSYPSPPPEIYDDEDAMDVDTPNKSWIPQPSFLNQQAVASRADSIPSPFYGHLPEAPIGPAHRLRNPPNKPSFRKTPAAQQETFFRNVTRRHSVAESDTESVDTRPMTPWTLQEPTFFAGPQDTGLEQIFGGVFSLKDDPQGLALGKQADQTDETTVQKTEQRPWTRGKRIASVVFLVLACIIWSQESTYSSSAWALQFAAFGIAVSTAAVRLVDALHPSKPVWILSDVLIFAVELGIAAGMAYLSRSAHLEGESTADALGRYPLLLSCVMLLQEAATLYKELGASALRVHAAAQPTAEPQISDPKPVRGMVPATAQSTALARRREETPTPRAPASVQAPASARPFTRSQRHVTPDGGLGGLSLGGMALDDSPGRSVVGAVGRNTRSRGLGRGF